MEDAVSCCRRRFAVCMDFGQARAAIEAISSQTGDRVGNRDARQARAVTEFASRFISTTCVLNSRKNVDVDSVKDKKDEDLTNLTFANHKKRGFVQVFS